jgi:PAS domain S-box-containing protein
VTVVGVAVLAGWILQLPALTSVAPGLATMKFNTALCFVLSGAALWTLTGERGSRTARRAAAACALGVLAIAALSLLEYGLGASVGIDEFAVRDPGTVDPYGAPGRMSVATAVNFVLVATGLLLFNSGERGRTAPDQWLFFAGGLIGLIALEGYAMGVAALYRFYFYSSVALHTAVLFVLLCLAALVARPERGAVAAFTSDRLGGKLARRALPFALLVPLAAGWLLLHGERLDFYETEFGVAAYAAFATVSLVAVIWLGARHLNHFHELLEERAVFSSRLAAIVESSNDAIFGVDLDGTVSSWNAGAEAIFGYPASEIVGRSMNLLVPEGRLEEKDQFLSRIRQGEKVEHVETVRRHKDGRLIDVSFTISPIRDEVGRIVGASKVGHDITRRRRAESARQRLAEELARSNSDLEAFTYSVSHDLRAPLRAIRGYTDILRRDHSAALAPEAGMLLDRVHENAQYMSSLIEELLEYSRVGREALRLEMVDLARLAREAAELLDQERGERQVEMVIAAMPPCVGDASLLGRVYQNLIANALKFTRRRERARIEVGGELRPGEFVGWVRDNGVGFDMRYADRLFGMFQRLHPQHEFEGTGVGLAIVKRSVEKHGGRVWAEGSTDLGATFYFSIPQSASAA